MAKSLGREYAKLWAASAASNVGDGVMRISAPLLAATLTREPILVAGAAFAHTLPWLLFTLVSGAMVDRLDRRRVMVVADFLRAALIAFLGVAVFLDLANLALMYAVFFLIGVAETFFDNASVTMLPAIVEKGELERANGRIFGVRIVANELAGPPLGGVLFAFAAAVPFFLTAGFFASAAAVVMAMRGRFRIEKVEGAPPTTLRAEISEGVRWLMGHRLLRTIAFTMAVLNITLSAALSIMVLVAQERLGLGSVGFGVLLASIAVGGLVGSLTAEKIVARFGPGTTMRVGLAIEASTHLVIALSKDAFVVGSILALFGLHAVVWSVISVSLRQSITPPNLLGRVNSAYMLFAAGGVSVGALLGGIVASSLGLTAPFWLSFVAVSILAAIIWRTLDNDTINAARS